MMLSKIKISRSSAIQKSLQAFFLGTVISILAVVCWSKGWLDRWEFRTWDWRVQLFSKPSVSSDHIRLIFLDQYSLDWGSRQNHLSWPWPREVYKPILEFCRRAGARVVIFDVLFTEPSMYGEEDDQRLGEGITLSQAFVGTVVTSREANPDSQWPEEPLRFNLSVGGVDNPTLPFISNIRRKSITFPIPQVLTQSLVLADVSANPDKDGIYRRLAPLVTFEDHPIPALGLGAFLAGNKSVSLTLDAHALRLGNAPPLPLDEEGQVILHYRGPSQTHKTVNAASVIQSELACKNGEKPPVDPDFFKDCYVFFGYTAPGLYDLRSSPTAGVYPGVEVQATLLDNLLANDALRDAPRLLVVVVAVFLAVLLAFATRYSTTVFETITVFVLGLATPLLFGLCFYPLGVWMPMVVLWCSSIPTMVIGLGINYITEGRQKQMIKGAFRQYLSPIVIDQLLQNPERLKLGGERRELTIYFSDIQGFTSISEKLDPERLTEFLNTYLTAMTDIILEEGGTVDKYEGDAIIAFWNAPLEQRDHVKRGVRTALKCQKILAEMRPDLEAKYGSKIFMRIGMNTGPVVVGNMGSNQRFDYTFLGDAGNLAARLEGMNKRFGTYFIISGTTRRALGDDFQGREISTVRVVGRREAVQIFEPVLPEEYALRSALFAEFSRALHDYYQGRFADAESRFSTLSKEDLPSAIYSQRCRDLLAAPPDQWDGVWSMTEK